MVNVKGAKVAVSPPGAPEMGIEWEERLMAMEDFIPSEQQLKLTVSVRDLFLIRSGLESLLRIYTRHEHLNREISELMGRLPEVGFEYELAA